MLQALFKREVEPLGEPADRRPHLAPVSAPNLSPKARAKPRAKAFPIALLYPGEPEPQTQVETLLCEIQTHAEDAIGKCVPQSHLERFYGELCKERGCKRRYWCVIGREFGKLTEKVFKKRGSKRFMAYQIQRA